MQKNLKRLALAALLSLSCLGITHFWYLRSEVKYRTKANANPIAFAVELDNEVLRRPVTRTIWQSLNEGEPLYPGEAIRTSSKGEVRIQFSDSKKFIDVEPDSLIVISQGTNKEISLDLMDGGLFVGSKEGQTSAGDAANSEFALTLKSADGKKVDLSSATAQLSKSNGSSLQVQVIDGKATVSGQDGTSQDLTQTNLENLFQIQSPSIDKPLFINPEKLEPIKFSWQSQDNSAPVGLFVGKNRKELKLSGVAKTPVKSIEQKLAPGRYFWKLAYLDDKQQATKQESQVYRIEVNPRYPPAVVAPTDKQLVEVAIDNKEVNFKWVKPEAAVSVALEIFSTKNPQKPLYSKTFASEDSFKQTLEEGTYIWKASAKYDQQVIWTDSISFQVVSQAKPPKPPVVVSWSDSTSDQQFFIDQPLASLKWTTNEIGQVKKWRVLLKTTEGPDVPEIERTIDGGQTEIKAALPLPGRYLASVEAIGEDNIVLAKVDSKTIAVEVLPLLSTTNFIPEQGDLAADNLGNIKLNWKALEGAKEYEVTLYNSTGKEIRKAKLKGQATSLVNLLPGRYQVKVRAIDKHNRLGEEGGLRTVIVPENSGVEAPKLRKIQVN